MKELSRRAMLGYAAVFTCLAGGGMLLIPRLAPAEAVLRPPGALSGKKFTATCIKCGQCLQVCPYHSVKLADIADGLSMGTPVITPSERGCYLCDLLPCVLSCPSGALDHNISEADITMGKAKIIAPERCLALSGTPVSHGDIDALRAGKKVTTQLERELDEKLTACAELPCRICVDFCPYPEPQNAIGLVPRNGGFVPEIREKCAGCGVCEELCPGKVFTTIAKR